MIEWVWPWAFVLLPLPVIARLLWTPVQREQAAHRSGNRSVIS